jgi:phage FluMu gp28-like protein
MFFIRRTSALKTKSMTNHLPQTEVEAREWLRGDIRWAWCKKYIEPNIKEAANDESAESLLPNHEFSIRNGSLLKAIVKCRKTAHSWGGVALKALARAATEDRSTTIIGSYDEDEAKEKLTFLDWQFGVLPDSEKRRLDMSDGSEVRRFKNGSRIKLISRKAPTGAGAAIEWDEFSIEAPGRVSAAEILVAAMGAITHTGSLTIGGTQRGAETMFNKIVSGEIDRQMESDPLFQNLPRRPWLIGEFPWWSSPALCVNVMEARIHAPAMDTAARVERFGNERLQFQFGYYCSTHGLEMFQREFEMRILDDRDSYFDLELIQSCYPRGDYFFIAPPIIEGKGYGRGSDILRHAKRAIDDLEREIRMGALRGYFGLTMDVGRDRDADEIWIAQVPHDDRNMLYPRINIGTNLLPWDGKEELLHYAMTHLPIVRGYLDATKGSIGVQLGERMHRRYGQRLAPFVFSGQNKQIIASSLKARMEQGNIILPPKTPKYDRLESQLLKIKKIISATGNVMFDADRNKGDHADSAWSLMMMSEMWEAALEWQPRRAIVMQRQAIALPPVPTAR